MRLTPRRLARRLLPVTVCAAALTGCGATSSTTISVESTTAAGHYAASAVVTPPRTAPGFTLRDQNGRRVRLSQFRGRAVILTFLYAHCPNVCPLIASKLHEALALLGPRARMVQMVAISVDPRGDRPAYVRRFLAERGMSGQMEYLLGTRAELAPVWRHYSVAVLPATRGSTVVGHAAVVYGISGSGKEETVYSADSFQPAAIAHDVPLLAAR